MNALCLASAMLFELERWFVAGALDEQTVCLEWLLSTIYFQKVIFTFYKIYCLHSNVGAVFISKGIIPAILSGWKKTAFA